MNDPTPIELLEMVSSERPVSAPAAEEFVRDWDTGAIADAQMGALCMASARSGLGLAAAVGMGRGLIASGDRLDLARFGPVVDLQTVGAVGDASLLVAAPLAASLGVRVVGLQSPGGGVLGGTLDLLDAIDGVQTNFDLAEMIRLVRDQPVVLGEVHQRICPAERRLWSTRVATGTAAAMELCVVSALARALAFGAPGIVVHLPVGPGCAARTAEESDRAQEIIQQLSAPFGRTVRVVVTNTSLPISSVAGPVLEVRQATAVLQGSGPAALREAAVGVAGAAAEISGVVTEGAGVERAREALASGAALRQAESWISSQGGDAGVLADTRIGTGAAILLALPAERAGRVCRLDAERVGEAARWVGAGRMHPTQYVDHGTGISLAVGLGDAVQVGDPLAFVHARDQDLADRAIAMLTAGIDVADA